MRRLVVAAVALLAPFPALATDPPPSGFYVGGHVGYGFGNATATLGDPIGGASSGGTNLSGMLLGGVQAGYDWALPSRWLLGIEADLTFPNYMDLAQVMSYRATATGAASEQLEYFGTLRGRVGYAMGGWTPYLTAASPGRACAIPAPISPPATRMRTPANIVWVMRSAAASTTHSTGDGRRGSNISTPRSGLPASPFLRRPRATIRSTISISSASGSTIISAPRTSRTTPPRKVMPGLVGDPRPVDLHLPGLPAVPRALRRPQQPAEQRAVARDLDGFRVPRRASLAGRRDLLQSRAAPGFRRRRTVGAAGYPNGEAQKSNFPFPQYNTSRLFLRQESGWAGRQRRSRAATASLAGEKDVSRLTFQIGKFAVHDLFDTNEYAGDSRTDFLNWSIWAAGAFDYPADRVGLTYGATAELNQASWAVRAGYFLVGNEPNANVFDWALLARRRLCRRARAALQAL